MRSIVRAKAPLRISLAGGGTDVSPYPEERGGAVISTTIDKYAYVVLKPQEEGIVVRSIGTDVILESDGCEDLRYDGNLDLVKAVIKHFQPSGGLELLLHSDAPMGAGLGSSSTLVVGIVGAFAHWLRIPFTRYEIAELAYHLEREEVGFRGGRQDQYSATFGGFNFIEFQGEASVVNPLRLPWNILNELHYCLLMVFTGQTRLSPGIIRSQQERYEQRQLDTVTSLDRTKELAYEMKDALLQQRLIEMGELLHEGWEQKKRFTDQITNPYIDSLYDAAREAGAIGGKLLGAGGGGHMLFLCRPDAKHRVAARVTEQGAPPVPFAFDFDGLQTWTVGAD
ncbi:MAG: GHMP kinase [Dehalococcoidia bacterium]